MRNEDYSGKAKQADPSPALYHHRRVRCLGHALGQHLRRTGKYALNSAG